jgi:hypothetical protein
VFCDLDCVFCAPKRFQLIHRFVITMRQDKPFRRYFLDRNLTEKERSSQRKFEALLERIRHLGEVRRLPDRRAALMQTMGN